MMERTRPDSENLPQDLIPYVREIAGLLGTQGRVLSLAGMNKGRHTIGKLWDLSVDVLVLVVNDEDLYPPFDWTNEHKEVNSMDHYDDITQRLDRGELVPPTLDINDRCKDLLTSLRVIYYWVTEIINTPDPRYLATYAEAPVGIPVAIVSRMLDPLVDQERALGLWESMRGSEEELEGFYEDFRISLLPPLKLDRDLNLPEDPEELE